MFYFVSVALIVVAEASLTHFESGETCPSWSTYNSSTESCVCGSSLLGIVDCRTVGNGSVSVLLMICRCMSTLNDYHQNDSTYVVGECIFTCSGHFHDKNYLLYRSLDFSENGDDEVCLSYYRKGPMCGNCLSNYAPPAYYYNFTCTKCSDDYRLNWIKYISMAYFPLTAFYFLVLILKISATTGSMNALVTICQLAAAPGIVRFYFIPHHTEPLSNLIKLVTTVCTIWFLSIAV